MSIPLQRVKLLRRRAQANAPAASYWLRRVLDDGGAMTRRVHRARGYNNHKSRYFFSASQRAHTAISMLFRETFPAEDEIGT